VRRHDFFAVSVFVFGSRFEEVGFGFEQANCPDHRAGHVAPWLFQGGGEGWGVLLVGSECMTCLNDCGRGLNRTLVSFWGGLEGEISGAVSGEDALSFS